jgi:hypothetical protein
MKPLNSKERTHAFYKVIGWFVFCFALAIILGYCTMNVNNYTDYASRKQLEALQNDLLFQEKVFQPNIDDATRKLTDLPKYKEKNLIPADITSSINVSLEKIKKDWKVDEKDQKYIMYKNVVDIYFALESNYLNTFKMEERLAEKEGVVQTGAGDLTRELKIRDGLEKENQSLKSEKDLLSTNAEKFQTQADKLQNQLIKCRDSLTRCMRDIKVFRQR